MIYILEDDESIRELICYSISKTVAPARGFARPSEFYSALDKEMPQLLLLDIMLPEEDGLSVLKKMRENPRSEKLPIIMLTAKNSEFDKVTALDLGADDYVTKPFGVMELVARVKALIRRSSKSIPEDFVEGGLCVSASRHEVTVNGVPVALTYKEFELLSLLFEHRGEVLGRDRILREIWGYEFDGENRTVDVHVRTLRQKLGKYADVVETVRGVGYRALGARKL